MSKDETVTKEAVEEETPVEESIETPTKAQPDQNSPAGLLAQTDGSPSQDQIDKWKVEHGDVYVSGFSASEVFIFRSLFRPEYIKIQQDIADGRVKQTEIEETTCSICVLWPANVDWNKGKAGTPVVLSELIMQNSNFMNPQTASYLVAKL